ncbi:hypothetical protein P4112_24745 [Pseudomonas aeruginosa]|nr:hypothetical protein [Pseudomonas aeruginosa]
MPKTMIEQAVERRERGQFKRAVDKLETLTGQRVELLPPTSAPSATVSPEQLAAAQANVARLTTERKPALQLPDDPSAATAAGWHWTPACRKASP